jgi:hypothetical protein
MNAMPVNMPDPVPEPGPAALSQAERIVDTFIAPSKTFTDLRRCASWWLPFLLIAIVSLGFVYTIDKKVGFRQVAENQAQTSTKRSQQLEQMSPAERERNMDIATKFTRYFSYGSPVLILIWYLMVSAVLLGTFKLGAGADLTFGTTLAVVIYAALPQLLRSLLAIISLVAGANPESFSIQNPVATNAGYFLNPANSRFLYSVASAVDVFTIWTLVLVAIGLSCVSKLKRSTAMAGVFGWFVVITLIGAAFAARS